MGWKSEREETTITVRLLWLWTVAQLEQETLGNQDQLISRLKQEKASNVGDKLDITNIAD